MKALITIAALTLSFSVYAADHHKGHGADKAKKPAATDAKAAAPADAAKEANCKKTTKTPADFEACMKKGETADHM